MCDCSLLPLVPLTRDAEARLESVNLSDDEEDLGRWTNHKIASQSVFSIRIRFRRINFFWTPGSASGSVIYLHGSGSFHQHAKK
jgi:hypothetical protein